MNMLALSFVKFPHVFARFVKFSHDSSSFRTFSHDSSSFRTIRQIFARFRTIRQNSNFRTIFARFVKFSHDSLDSLNNYFIKEKTLLRSKFKLTKFSCSNFCQIPKYAKDKS